jgi:histidinol-phosphate/aromatic aminotransferase/cobyric acid decarboxylase-like protein
MHKAQSPYSVNMLAAVAARAAIRDPDYVRRYVDEALAARQMICDGFGAMQIDYFPSQANFVLFRAGTAPSRFAINCAQKACSFATGATNCRLRPCSPLAPANRRSAFLAH